MPLLVSEILGRPVSGGLDGDDVSTRYVRRVEFVGAATETMRVRLYASAATASQAHGDDRDCIYNVDWSTGAVTLNVEETVAFRRGEPLRQKEE